MLKKCPVNKEDPNTVDSQSASRDSSPAGATGSARAKVGKFINMTLINNYFLQKVPNPTGIIKS